MKRFEGLNPVHTPGVLVKNHGPFSWGKNAQDAVHLSLIHIYKPHFPSATLLPGDEYQQITVYKFDVEE